MNDYLCIKVPSVVRLDSGADGIRHYYLVFWLDLGTRGSAIYYDLSPLSFENYHETQSLTHATS
jgi:hypothetical protein